MIEPLLPLGRQAQLWSAGFGVLAMLISVARLYVARLPNDAVQAMDKGVVSTRVIAVTSYVTTDIAAAPLLWVLPLALYLLTFVAVFQDRAWIRHDTVALAVPLVVAPLAIGLLGRDPVFWLAVMSINLVAFFLLALLCHGALYRRRPAPARLTEFYFWVALGGVLGGAFAALLAPRNLTRN